MMTQRDPWVNMLRTTIAAFSAGIGGADAITVLPFTAALGLPDRFARRIARNTQLLLLEESNVAKVADPAAGSGGIEDLTDKLCRAAWTLFQEIEAAGGAPAALEAGLIQEKVAGGPRRARGRRRAPQGRADRHQRLSVSPKRRSRCWTCTPVPTLAKPIAKSRFRRCRRIRLAEPFEHLRDASDRMLARDRRAAEDFPRQSRHVAEFTARATFAKTLLRGRRHRGRHQRRLRRPRRHDRGVQGVGREARLPCSSDEVYAREAADAAKALKAAGATHIYLAGRPKDADALKAAGVGTFIFAGWRRAGDAATPPMIFWASESKR